MNAKLSYAENSPLNFHTCTQIDARQQAEHLHDAVTWFKENPLVDETKIALWGLCFGGNVTLAAAAFEFVILHLNLVCGLFSPVLLHPSPPVLFS